MSQGAHWKKSNTVTRTHNEDIIGQSDKIERIHMSLVRKESQESEAFTEQRTLHDHHLRLQESLNLSSISRSNQPSLAGAFSGPASRKMHPASHFGRKKEVPVVDEEAQKLEALRVLLHSLEGEEVSRIKVESVTSAMLDNSERISVPSNLVSGRSGFTAAVHSSTTVTQTPQEKEMLMKLSKIKAEKAKELRESRYFLLRVRLDDLNQNIAQLRTESARLDDQSQKNRPASRYNGSIAEISPSPVESQPAIVDQKLVDLASKIGRLVKSIESLENKLKVSKCKQSLLNVQTAILEEGFLSANLSGSKASNTKEVYDIKTEAIQLIKAVNLALSRLMRVKRSMRQQSRWRLSSRQR